MKRYLPFIIVIAVALITIVGATMFYRSKRPPALVSAAPRSTSNNAETVHMRGNGKAPITVEEYGDYECPPCGKLAEPLKQIERDYGDRLRVIFHHFPLIVHAHAKEAAWAAEAAALQGKFWEMHDLLYREQSVWSKVTDVRSMFASYAGTIGLDVERFKHDLESDAVKTRVDADQGEGASIGVKSTPSLFVNNRYVAPAGADLVKPLRDAIEEALKPKPAG